MPKSPVNCATVRCWSSLPATWSCIERILMRVRLGSTSASARRICGSSSPIPLDSWLSRNLRTTLSIKWVRFSIICAMESSYCTCRQRHEKQWRSPMAAGIGIVCGAHNADDFIGTTVLYVGNSEVRADRIFALLKELAHECFIYDGRSEERR